MKVFFVFCFILSVFALDNGLALTPPMGWLPWEQFQCQIDCEKYPTKCIHENLFLDMMDRLVEDGYRDAGYKINIDDCWSAKKRNDDGFIIADPIRFSHGIPYLVETAHSKGLLLGIYNDYGTLTCMGYPGSEGNLIKDAQTFASWGIDALKMDGCYSKTLDHPDAYPGMSHFLNATGQHILFSCSWPAYAADKDNYTYYEMLPKHCNLWRNYGDITKKWEDVLDIINMFGNTPIWGKYAGPGHWNDPDMLVIGMKDGLNKYESETQLALWSILAAPLYMTNDLRDIDDWAREILLNKEVIAIDQDILGKQGYRLTEKDNDQQVWVRPLSDNRWAIALLNSGEKETSISINFKDINVSGKVQLRDLFLHKDLGTFESEYTNSSIQPHAVQMMLLTQ
ncbi:hypothetical protein WA158_002662 [Blastocystis sp. Blastoise]